MVTSTGKIIRLRVADIRVIGRNTQGVRLIDIEEGERVVSVARLAEQDDEETSELPEAPETAETADEPETPESGD
jgi:DNA gyrase subunit A